ncbi:hypothetical protein AB870_15180 [Pandoraea faecigallinarum]|uniref:Uncharacterized protein n=1 Tax=Pandoraea faecigallinarum TaxID=656179 RepID=A0A0H3WSL7_9BURK|nr:hypothetical protein [Pandoraea faecigallinarum]AKM31174.1 hypothetical protein AB870_15180 [Pandoraea faecigallinarum]
MVKGESTSDDVPNVDLSLVQGDPGFHLQRRLRLIPETGMGTARRAFIFAAVSWLPLAIWALVTGRAFSHGNPDDTLVAHFGIHARCLIAIPLMVVAEGVAQKLMPPLFRYFVESGIVTPETLPGFRDRLAAMARLRDRTLPWVVILAATMAWSTVGAVVERAEEMAWLNPGDDIGSITFGGWWFILVIRPLFTALLLVWLWRACLLFVLLCKLGRMPLALVPSHPDRVGGLSFVERLAFVFSPVAFAVSAVVAASFAHEVVYHGASAVQMKTLLVASAALISLVFLIPLLPLAVPLGALKRRAIFDYGSLVAHHDRLVHQRWILHRDIGTPDILDAPELGPVADIHAIYEAVRRMRSIPFSKLSIVAIVVPAAVPMLYVAAMQLPLSAVLGKVLKALV